MKKTILLIFLLCPMLVVAGESQLYLDKGYAIKAYDLVAYFDDKPAVGDKDRFSYRYKGTLFAFSNQENLTKFKENPEKYIPQYGGHCSYAMATRGKKVSPDPEVFEIREGKLYLFHASKGLRKWLAGDTEKLRMQADTNWQEITSMKAEK